MAIKRRSREITGQRGSANWVQRSAARAMLRAVRFTDADFDKPLIALAVTHTNDRLGTLFEAGVVTSRPRRVVEGLCPGLVAPVEQHGRGSIEAYACRGGDHDRGASAGGTEVGYHTG